MIEEIFNSGFQQHQSSGKFSISGIGSCWRKKYMEMKGLLKTEYDEKTLRIFKLGDAVHRISVAELMMKGPSQGFEVAAAEINVPENEFISGRADCLLSRMTDGSRYIIDFKSVSPWVFKQVVAGEIAKIQNYVDQINLYLHLFKLKTGFLLFVNKASCEVKEWKVEYDEVRATKQFKEIENFFVEHVRKDVLPPKCNNIISPYGCEACGTPSSFGGFK